MQIKTFFASYSYQNESGHALKAVRVVLPPLTPLLALNSTPLLCFEETDMPFGSS